MDAAEARELGALQPGIMRKMRSARRSVSLVWKPTMLNSVPSALSWRSCTTAYGRLPVRGSISPTGFIGP